MLENSVGKSTTDGVTRSSLPTAGIVLDDTFTISAPKDSEDSYLSWLTALIWPLMSILPLLLTAESLPTHYAKLFPSEWYRYDPNVDERPKPLGLTLGILTVALGHLFLIPIFYAYREGYLSGKKTGFTLKENLKIEPKAIQKSGARFYNFYEGLVEHLSQPEGFVLLGIYLTATWMFKLMPLSYYSFDGNIQWVYVFACLVIQDGLQFVMHLLEHSVSKAFYNISHKPHHKFHNPRLFDAFNGSVADTVLMILLPLYATANLMRYCNVWTYMAFGTMYANWLVLIHSEYVFPWDCMFRKLGLGTPGDHHVHHKVFKYNYGHTFMWFDWICGTYRSPAEYAPKIFNHGT